MKRYIAGFLVCAAVCGADIARAQNTKYGVTVTAAKNTDFGRFKTYSWTRSRPSTDKAVDAQVMAAVERELGALGMTQAAAGGAPDVLVTYSSLSRSDVDVTGKADASGARPQYAVGTLVVALLDSSSRKELLRLRADKAIEPAPSLEPVINAVVGEMFEKYPTRQLKK